ncbi:MAG: hypothetical protein AAB405_02080 [Patescibacteria group bacterium]
MNQEIKTCQNCKQNFTIESEDFAFYDKIKVPPPTWCSECRMIRRMNWRNERTLYKRKCDAPGHNEEIISIYHKDSPFKVYDYKYWWSDEWDSLIYGKDYDFSQPFFEQFKELLREVPHNNLVSGNNVNSEYVNFQANSKDCYLATGGQFNEQVIYSNHVVNSKDSTDLYFVFKIELGYDDVICQNSYRLFYSQNCDNCIDSYFLYDCRNCQNCFSCVGLRNKQYYIFNKPYSKEEYEKKLREFNLGNFNQIKKQKELFNEFKLRYPYKFINSVRGENISGDNISDAKNCKYAFDILPGGSENCKFLWWSGNVIKDVYDGNVGMNVESSYENISVINNVSRVLFSVSIWTGYDIQYSENCHNSSNLFACVGLRNKQYCILNKQYTKEEYEKLVPQIIEYMNNMPYTDKQGRIYKYGEFFPPELSPFSYNETIAQEYFPLTKQQAIEQGYSWKDPEQRNINITLKSEDLPDNIKDVKDDIINQIIECQHQNNPPAGGCNEQCTEAFKIIQPELDFYKKMNLPLPRLCPNCRHYQRLKQRNPLKLWKRQCQCAGNKSENEVYQNTIAHTHGEKHCENTFETTYAPERPEIVYCEKCYQQEVM